MSVFTIYNTHQKFKIQIYIFNIIFFYRDKLFLLFTYYITKLSKVRLKSPRDSKTQLDLNMKENTFLKKRFYFGERNFILYHTLKPQNKKYLM